MYFFIGEMIVKAGVAGFMTKLVGEIYQVYFSRGGSLKHISVATVADYISYQLRTERYAVDSLINQFTDSAFKKFGLA